MTKYVFRYIIYIIFCFKYKSVSAIISHTFHQRQEALHYGRHAQGKAASGALIADGHQLIKAGPPGPGVAGEGGCERLAGLGLSHVFITWGLILLSKIA